MLIQKGGGNEETCDRKVMEEDSHKHGFRLNGTLFKCSIFSHCKAA